MFTDITPTDERSVVLVNVGVPLENAKHELFAQRVAAGASYKDAYEAAFPNPTQSARHHASRLAHDITIRARVQQLTRATAERATHSIAERLQTLVDIASADPGELARVVDVVCGHCWTDEAVAAVLDAGMLPDTTAPRPDCRKGPHKRVELTPTSELSGQARRLLKGARQKADGSIEVTTHDQLAATRLLAELSGWLVQQNANLNFNANAAMPASPAPVSTQDVLDAFHALRTVRAP
jgi:hypothetical protein